MDVYRIHTEPLRSRPEDIAPLASHFASVHGGPGTRIAREALRMLERLPWKGNVRELSAVVQRAVVESEGSDLRAPHFKTQNLSGKSLAAPLPLKAAEVNGPAFENYLDQHLREYLQVALDLFEGDTLALAKALKLSRATVYNKMNRLGIRNGTS